MRIAICDDELAAREQIVSFTEDYARERRIELDYAVFDSYEGLRDRIGEFDVFILDYQMPQIDGLTFASMIREQYGQNCKAIIFVTSYDEIVYDAFVVQAHRFLVKPLQKEKYFEALDAYQKTSQTNRQIVIKGKDETSVLQLQDVYYVEVDKKDLYFCTENEQILCRRTIESVEQELAPLGFFRAHRSYLVNLYAVRSFDRAHVVFANGERVPLSARKYTALGKAYLELT